MSWIKWLTQAFSVKYGRASVKAPIALNIATYGANKLSHTSENIMHNASGNFDILPRTCGTQSWSASGGTSSTTVGPDCLCSPGQSDILSPDGGASLSLVGWSVDEVCLQWRKSVFSCRSLQMGSRTSEQFSSLPAPYAGKGVNSTSGLR